LKRETAIAKTSKNNFTEKKIFWFGKQFNNFGCAGVNPIKTFVSKLKKLI